MAYNAEYDKEYRNKNKEHIAEKKKEYYNNNKEIIIQKTREYKQSHAEQYKEYNNKYRALHKEERNKADNERYIRNQNRCKTCKYCTLTKYNGRDSLRCDKLNITTKQINKKSTCEHYEVKENER